MWMCGPRLAIFTAAPRIFRSLTGLRQGGGCRGHVGRAALEFSYYARGVTEERSKHRDNAERDLLEALKLKPNEPQVLNYLGYSWVDQGRNLKEAVGMLEKARSLRPLDGYIVDSVGWAYYRLGQYKDAASTLEEAVLLTTPADPTINDHLGDAYWRVGGKWKRVFSGTTRSASIPAYDQKAIIQRKLDNGLDAGGASDGIRVFAPAKINLFLHVGAKRADGFHTLESLVVFAETGDRLTFAPAAQLSLRGEGLFAAICRQRKAIWFGRQRGLWAASAAQLLVLKRIFPWRQALVAARPMRRPPCAGSICCGSSAKAIRN